VVEDGEKRRVGEIWRRRRDKAKRMGRGGRTEGAWPNRERVKEGKSQGGKESWVVIWGSAWGRRGLG
jgi:hypothetical protein